MFLNFLDVFKIVSLSLVTRCLNMMCLSDFFNIHPQCGSLIFLDLWFDIVHNS